MQLFEKKLLIHQVQQSGSSRRQHLRLPEPLPTIPVAGRRKRSCADILCFEDVHELGVDLATYVQNVYSIGDVKFCFGVYGTQQGPGSTPDLTVLLANKDLLKILLKFMPKGNMKDAYMVQAMTTQVMPLPAMSSCKAAPNFVVWFTQATHRMLSHIRDLKRYKLRYEYRMSKLNEQQRLDIQELLDMSTATVHSPAASPRPQSPAPSTAAKSCASVSDGVSTPFDDNTSDTAEQMLLNKGMPAMFLTVEGDAKPDIENATKKNSSADALDQRHAGSSATPAARPPGAVQLGPPDYGFSTGVAKARESLSKALALANSTPPLPSKRGAIKQQAKARRDLKPSEIKAYKETTTGKRPRSSVRVKIKGEAADSKETWAHCSAKTSANHARHCQILVDMIGTGEIPSAERCNVKLKQLLDQE